MEYSQNGKALNQRSKADVVDPGVGGYEEGVAALFPLLREFTSQRFAPFS